MKIVFAWGGTWGHIHPSIAIASEIWWESLFVISRSKLDRDIIKNTKHKYKTIFSWKLRRYFSFQNFTDIPKIIAWIIQSFFVLLSFKPDKVFAKWGFVALPVCIAAWILRVPVILHESDSVTGLANRIIEKFATKCIKWMKDWLNPIRIEAKRADPIIAEEEIKDIIDDKARRFSEFSVKQAIDVFAKIKSWKLKILLVMWWSQWASQLNKLITKIFDKISDDYFVINLTWKDKKTWIKSLNYIEFEYLDENYFHFLSRADLIISRAWASSLAEILHFRKPSIIIPLDSSSADHQRKNAHMIEHKHLAFYVDPTFIDDEKLVELMHDNKTISKIQENLNKHWDQNAAKKIAEIIVCKN